MFVRTIAWILLLVAFTHAYCPPGFIHHVESCYHFSHDQENWYDAVGMCQLLGGELAEITSPSEDSYLAGEVKKRHRIFWVGGNDLAVEGSWVWQSSRAPISQATYIHWSQGSPSNSRNNENCMTLVESGVWNDDACHRGDNYYICETLYGEEPVVIG